MRFFHSSPAIGLNASPYPHQNGLTGSDAKIAVTTDGEPIAAKTAADGTFLSSWCSTSGRRRATILRPSGEAGPVGALRTSRSRGFGFRIHKLHSAPPELQYVLANPLFVPAVKP